MRFGLIPRKGGAKEARRRFAVSAAVFVLLLLTTACLWASRSFKDISLEECLFYLSMPLQGTTKDFSDEIFTRVIVRAFLCFLAYLMLTVLPVGRSLVLHTRKGRTIRILPLRPPRAATRAILILWFCVVLPYGDSLLHIRRFVFNQMKRSKLIEERYVDASDVPVIFPEKKRNLITLYLESAETTNQDRENGGFMDRNYTPEMTRMAKENVSFSQSDRIEGAAVGPASGWTVAGLIAEAGGVPLKLFSYNDARVDNMGGGFISFLPGVTMLGDLLEREGYRNVFLCGSKMTFGGRDHLYQQHGNYEIYDYTAAKKLGWIPEDYRNGWGFEDEKLYAYARDILMELSAGDKPFHLALLTVDTHPPGYLCGNCPDTGESDFERVLRCSSDQAYRFVEWCKAQPFFENTTIVLAGDHASMAWNSLYEKIDEYDKHSGSQTRLVYNCFINAAVSPVREKNRRFTTMDLYPTTLAAIGCEIGGNRLGLGVNLFSGEDTIAEEIGYDAFFEELEKKSTFYDQKLLR